MATDNRLSIPIESERHGLALGLGDGFAGVTAWIVPAATIAGPGLLLLLLVGLQALGAVAWIPAVRRLREERGPT